LEVKYYIYNVIKCFYTNVANTGKEKKEKEKKEKEKKKREEVTTIASKQTSNKDKTLTKKIKVNI